MKNIRSLTFALSSLIALAPTLALADHWGHDRGWHEGWRHERYRNDRCDDYRPIVYRTRYRSVTYRPRYVRYDPVDRCDRSGVTIVLRF